MSPNGNHLDLKTRSTLFKIQISIQKREVLFCLLKEIKLDSCMGKLDSNPTSSFNKEEQKKTIMLLQKLSFSCYAWEASSVRPFS